MSAQLSKGRQVGLVTAPYIGRTPTERPGVWSRLEALGITRLGLTQTAALESSSFSGTLVYLAPEVVSGKAATAQSDVYALGVMLYQMLTGTLPYFSPNPAQIERMVAAGRCTPPKLRNSQIPKEVSDIVMKARASEVSERYPRANQLLDDLATSAEIDHKATEMDDIRKRLKAREVPKKGFCWHCRKPLHARSDSCPFCGEKQ